MRRILKEERKKFFCKFFLDINLIAKKVVNSIAFVSAPVMGFTENASWLITPERL